MWLRAMWGPRRWGQRGPKKTSHTILRVRSPLIPRRHDGILLLTTLIGSRALVAYGDVDESSAANNHPWWRKCTARRFRKSDTSSSAYGWAGTHSVQLAGAGSVGCS